MKAFPTVALLLGLLLSGQTPFTGQDQAVAQEPDSLIVINMSSPPGDTALTWVMLRNNQFSVGGFSMRFVLKDSVYTSFERVERGSAVDGFDHFFAEFSEGTCRVVGIADLPGGADTPPLPVGFHELARVYIFVDDSAPWGDSDSIIFMDDSLPPERDNSISDSTGYINLVPSLIGGRLLFDLPTGIGDEDEKAPRRMELFQNRPNPFNAETSISFFLPVDDYVSISIFDLLGRMVRNYSPGNLLAGKHTIIWDGRDDRGQQMASGIYFYRLESMASGTRTMRMTLLK